MRDFMPHRLWFHLSPMVADIAEVLFENAALFQNSVHLSKDLEFNASSSVFRFYCAPASKTFNKTRYISVVTCQLDH